MSFFRALKSKKTRNSSLDSVRKLLSEFKEQKRSKKVKSKIRRDKIRHIFENSNYRNLKDTYDETH